MDNAQLINQDSGDYEYYTPPEIVEAAKEVMGTIDLDPASSEKANKIVKAAKIYTLEQKFEQFECWDLPALTWMKGGLDEFWHGNVWMNHPFSKSEAPCKPDCNKEICKKRGYHTTLFIQGNKEWIEAAVEEYESGRAKQLMCITYAATSEEWFRPLHNHNQCYLIPRTNYYLPDGTKKKGVTKGSVVTYMGPYTDIFEAVFSKFGAVK